MLQSEAVDISFCSNVRYGMWNYPDKNLYTCDIDETQIIDHPNFVMQNEMVTKTITSLTIKDNRNVKYPPKKIANAFPHLTSLVISNCSLRFIEADAFENLIWLKTLAIYGNEIQWIDEKAFESLALLELLQLNNNKLRILAPKTFSTMAQLKIIYLNDNELLFLPSKIFSNNQLLVEIYMQNNVELKNWDSKLLENLYNLKNFSSSGVNISEIDKDLFKDNENLEYIWLNNCKIRYIGANTFSRMKNLKFINLKENICVNEMFQRREFSELYLKCKKLPVKSIELEQLKDEQAKLKTKLNESSAENVRLQNQIKNLLYQMTSESIKHNESIKHLEETARFKLNIVNEKNKEIIELKLDADVQAKIISKLKIQLTKLGNERDAIHKNATSQAKVIARLENKIVELTSVTEQQHEMCFTESLEESQNCTVEKHSRDEDSVLNHILFKLFFGVWV